MPFNLFGLFDRGQSVKLVEEIPSGTKVIGGITGQVSAEVKGFVTAQVTAGWPVGVTGQVTARGEVTAIVSAGWPIGVTGQVTAHGTVTAQVGEVTARGAVTAIVSAGWPIGVTGQVTAHGTITAAVGNVVTAESRGQVTAVGAVTAIVSAGWPLGVTGGPIGVTGEVTAQVQGIVTARSPWLSAFLVSGITSTGTGQALETRNYPNAGYVWVQASGCSASATLLASHDSAGWMPVTSFGLADLATATAQVSGYFPYLCARVDAAYVSAGSAAGIWMHVTKV